LPFAVSRLRTAITLFKPDVFLLDPWNQAVRDSTERDYSEGFERVRACLPTGDDCPALGIVAHTRKPRMGEKASGPRPAQLTLPRISELTTFPSS
jgi:hypothetical protein